MSGGGGCGKVTEKYTFYFNGQRMTSFLLCSFLPSSSAESFCLPDQVSIVSRHFEGLAWFEALWRGLGKSELKALLLLAFF